jgi:hypothetical protein
VPAGWLDRLGWRIGRTEVEGLANNAFGKHPEELAAALDNNDGAASTYRRLGATIIDGTRPPAEVADAILAVTRPR